MTVRIYKMTRSCDVVFWLCDDHKAKREADGWMEVTKKDPPHELTCQDCVEEEIAAMLATAVGLDAMEAAE